jgi:hypothetical protein
MNCYGAKSVIRGGEIVIAFVSGGDIRLDLEESKSDNFTMRCAARNANPRQWPQGQADPRDCHEIMAGPLSAQASTSSREVINIAVRLNRPSGAVTLTSPMPPDGVRSTRSK